MARQCAFLIPASSASALASRSNPELAQKGALVEGPFFISEKRISGRADEDEN
jgi:hypothetical protein